MPTIEAWSPHGVVVGDASSRQLASKAARTV
jgi:hypothetical protein